MQYPTALHAHFEYLQEAQGLQPSERTMPGWLQRGYKAGRRFALSAAAWASAGGMELRISPLSGELPTDASIPGRFPQRRSGKPNRPSLPPIRSYVYSMFSDALDIGGPKSVS